MTDTRIAPNTRETRPAQPRQQHGTAPAPHLLEGSTNDSALSLDRPSGLAALDLRSLGLLVHAAPGLGPLELGRLLALLDHGLGLGSDHDHQLRSPVTTSSNTHQFEETKHTQQPHDQPNLPRLAVEQTDSNPQPLERFSPNSAPNLAGRRAAAAETRTTTAQGQAQRRYLAILAHEADAVAGVDAELGEGAQFGPFRGGKRQSG